MRGITFTAATAVTLVFGWLVVGPLFVDQTVDESFPLTLADGSLNMPAIMALPQANRTLMKPRIMRTAAKLDSPVSELMPSSVNASSLLAAGQFQDADKKHQGSGYAKIYGLTSTDAEHEALLRLESFSSTNGPALVVYLSKHANPRSAEDVLANEYLSLGKLKGNLGNQHYLIPAGTKLEQYPSVVIWCELFGVLFSTAPLSPAAQH